MISAGRTRMKVGTLNDQRLLGTKNLEIIREIEDTKQKQNAQEDLLQSTANQQEIVEMRGSSGEDNGGL